MTPRSTRRWIIVAVALQALVLVLLPLRAGDRIPSGTTVVLSATAGSTQLQKDVPSQEIVLDYDFDELDVPDSIDAGDVVAVRVRPAGGSEPARLGPVVADGSRLPEGSIWITLPTVTSRSGKVIVDAGPIFIWYDEDLERVDDVRDALDDSRAVLVTIELDNDGDPTIDSVRAAE